MCCSEDADCNFSQSKVHHGSELYTVMMSGHDGSAGQAECQYICVHVYQPEVELFKLSCVLQQVLDRLLHVSVGHQFLLSKLGKVDYTAQVPSKPI